jgi:hypothetical protein
VYWRTQCKRRATDAERLAGRIFPLGDQIGEADQQKDRKKAEALVQKMNELEKQLDPE